MSATRTAPAPLWEFLAAPSEAGDPRRRVVAATGTRVTFADGVEALCATSGLWNVNFGYGNPVIAARVRPVLTGVHYASLFRSSHDLAIEAAAALLDATSSPGHRYSRVVFSTSGSAAVDLAMKMARHWSLLGDEPARRTIVGLRDSYHGMTYGSFSLTGEPLGQEAYGVDRRHIRHVHDDDGSDLRLLAERHGSTLAAIVLEPVAGTGARPLGEPVLRAALELRRRHGCLVIADEIATGYFRTGPFLASERWPEPPDAVILSKGLTNGLSAASAIVVNTRIAERFDAADATLVHGETQAGCPVSAAAVLGTLEFIAARAPQSGVPALSGALDDALLRLTSEHPGLTARGVGLFRYLGRPGGDVAVQPLVERIRLAGAVVHPGPSGIQLLPQVVTDVGSIVTLRDAISVGLSEVGL